MGEYDIESFLSKQLCDVWSMGVTLYCLVTGKVPWDGSGSIIGVQSAIRSEQLRFPEKPRLSEDLCDLLSRMLAKDPAKRIDLADIKEHCWLTNNGSEALPSETENCRLPVTVTDEEVARVVTRVPKLDTLILIKTMLKQHSFQVAFHPLVSSQIPLRFFHFLCKFNDTKKKTFLIFLFFFIFTESIFTETNREDNSGRRRRFSHEKTDFERAD